MAGFEVSTEGNSERSYPTRAERTTLRVAFGRS